MLRIALAISGQARPFENKHGHKYLEFFKSNLIDPNNCDVFCAFWDEPLAAGVLECYGPNTNVLVSPDEFPAIKQEFFDDYCKTTIKRFSPYKDVDIDWFLDARLRLLNGEVSSAKYPAMILDNTVRMFYLMSKVLTLIPEGYDYIVRARPDLYIPNEIKIESLEDNVIFNNFNNRHNPNKTSSKTRCSDQFFYGKSALIRKLCDWNTLPDRLVTLDLRQLDKIRRKEQLLVKGFMTPEPTIYDLTLYVLGATFTSGSNKDNVWLVKAPGYGHGWNVSNAKAVKIRRNV